MRMLSSVGRIDAQRIRTGRMRDTDWPKLVRAVTMLEKAPIYIDDTPSLKVLDLRAKTRRLKKEKNIGLIVVDYLQLMRGYVTESREQEISSISRALKALAKELDIPVLALSQLNRGVESRSDKRPMLSDLRESGAIEQDADVIMFIYRQDFYSAASGAPETGGAEVIIGKQRNGPTGNIEMVFLKEIATFENLAPDEFVPNY